MNHDLQHFLKNWDRNYTDQVKEIALFDTRLTKQWTREQKARFIKIFYHVRGHFYVLLWHLGNFSPSRTEKDMVLYNIQEEFGSCDLSHEQLYFNFARYFDIDLTDEIIYEHNNLPFVKNFNHGHLAWFLSHNWNYRMAAFSAYERLDNVDYSNLFKLGKSLGADGQALQFFLIHAHADHFDRTISTLNRLWASEQEVVKQAFAFVEAHQVEMWRLLSDEIFKHGSI